MIPIVVDFPWKEGRTDGRKKGRKEERTEGRNKEREEGKERGRREGGKEGEKDEADEFQKMQSQHRETQYMATNPQLIMKGGKFDDNSAEYAQFKRQNITKCTVELNHISVDGHIRNILLLYHLSHGRMTA